MSIRPVKLFVLTILAISLLGTQMVFSSGTTSSDESKSLDYLRSMMNMIKTEYKGDINDKKLIEGALKGMFATMDPYTEYYTPEEAKSFLNSIGGSYEGVGISIEEENKSVLVVDVYPGSPASKAGISSGDKIIKVDGKDISGMTIDDVSGMLKGEAGTKVKIDIIKAGRKDLTTVEVSREKISINPVSYKIDGDTGYIKLDIFNLNLDEFLTKALSEMDGRNIKKIILDLRNNPGGEVDQAIAAARKFVPEGLIAKLDFKSPDRQDNEYYSSLKEKKYRIAVLVNGNSASASEILAGAIQDTGAGTLIGTKTFGKAKVQNLYPLLTPEAFEKYKKQLGIDLVNAFDLEDKYNISPTDDEIVGWIKMTTGLYTTPKGRMIDTVGINPDISVENPEIVNNVEISSVIKLEKKVKPVINTENLDVESAEKILKMCGYFAGTPDVKFDNKTLEAVKKFQKANGLYAYGMLDFTTQQALNDRLDKIVYEADKQYLKAIEVLKK